MELDNETKKALGQVTNKEIMEQAVPPAYRAVVSFSAEEIDELRKRARAWIKEPEKRFEEIHETAWLSLLIIQKMMTAEQLPGRSGPALRKSLAKEYVAMAAKVMEIEKAHRLLTLKACPACGHELEEGVVKKGRAKKT